MELVKTNREHSSKFYIKHDTPLVTARQLNNIKRQKMVITTRVFDSVQLCWCGLNDHIDGNYRQNTPYDSVLHYAGGTLALKRIRLPQLPSHYQTFVELHQRSNGDAYDRTGSVFIIAFLSSLVATVSTTKASEKASVTFGSTVSPRSCTGHLSS